MGDGQGDSRGPRRATLGGESHYDDRDFVACLRTLNVTPHVAQKHTALDARTTRHLGYGVSRRFRKRVEEVFGWLKTVGLLRQTRHRGRDRVGWMFTFGRLPMWPSPTARKPLNRRM